MGGSGCPAGSLSLQNCLPLPAVFGPQRRRGPASCCSLCSPSLWLWPETAEGTAAVRSPGAPAAAAETGRTCPGRRPARVARVFWLSGQPSHPGRGLLNESLQGQAGPPGGASSCVHAPPAAHVPQKTRKPSRLPTGHAASKEWCGPLAGRPQVICCHPSECPCPCSCRSSLPRGAPQRGGPGGNTAPPHPQFWPWGHRGLGMSMRSHIFRVGHPDCPFARGPGDCSLKHAARRTERGGPRGEREAPLPPHPPAVGRACCAQAGARPPPSCLLPGLGLILSRGQRTEQGFRGDPSQKGTEGFGGGPGRLPQASVLSSPPTRGQTFWDPRARHPAPGPAFQVRWL